MIQRYVGYIRVSTEEQVGTFSIDSQRRDIETWVKRRGGQLIGTYVDEAISALTTDRPAFKQMRRDAAAGLFDAIVVYRFDRFSRNRVDAIAIKAIFSNDYNVQVFSILESAKTRDADKNLLFEALMESIAEHYVRDLSTATRRGKRERAMQGYHNNKAPFGFRKTPDSILYPHKEEAEAVSLAFELYASGGYSFTNVARILNDKGFRIMGKRRFSNDTVRDMLHNRVYAGYVRYRPSRPDGTRARRSEIEWYEGKHDAIISEELFERCQNNAENKTRDHLHHPIHRVYLLRNLIFCAQCVEKQPDNDDNKNYGKMRGLCLHDYTMYRCRETSHQFPL
jgi:DNA invertase Pin-like site-specific DNA recombinase